MTVVISLFRAHTPRIIQRKTLYINISLYFEIYLLLYESFMYINMKRFFKINKKNIYQNKKMFSTLLREKLLKRINTKKITV